MVSPGHPAAPELPKPCPQLLGPGALALCGWGARWLCGGRGDEGAGAGAGLSAEPAPGAGGQALRAPARPECVSLGLAGLDGGGCLRHPCVPSASQDASAPGAAEVRSVPQAVGARCASQPSRLVQPQWSRVWGKELRGSGPGRRAPSWVTSEGRGAVGAGGPHPQRRGWAVMVSEP